MKKIFSIVALLCAILMCFSSCGLKNNMGQHMWCMIGAAHAVPGMFGSDTKGDHYAFIEKDSYGRVLFSYKNYCSLSDQNVTAYVICQKYDKKYVYFYEDICYLKGEITEDQIEELKQLNDWDEEPDAKKMSRRQCNLSFDLFITDFSELEYLRLTAKVKKHFEWDDSQYIGLNYDDSDYAGHELYIVVGMDDSGVKQKYFCIINENYNIASLQITDENEALKLLPEFKQNNGWIYGF